MQHRGFGRVVYLFLFLLACSCGGASSVPGTPRSASRAAVDVAKDAWVLAANACVDAAQATKSKALLHKCAEPLTDARVLLMAAADAVDGTWTPQAGCDVLNAVMLVAKAVGALGVYGETIRPVVTDAVALAAGVAGTCEAPDAAPPNSSAEPPAPQVGEDADDNPYDLGVDAPEAGGQ